MGTFVEVAKGGYYGIRSSVEDYLHLNSIHIVQLSFKLQQQKYGLCGWYELFLLSGTFLFCLLSKGLT